MPNNNPKTLNVHDLPSVIEEAMRRLPKGEERLTLSESPLSHACLSQWNTAPDLKGRLLSDYGALAETDKGIESEYYEEVAVIGNVMKDSGWPINLSDWQSRTTSEAAKQMYEGLNRRAEAMEAWDWYAIPWRFRNGMVHLILSPNDVMGQPIVLSCPIGHFLKAIAETFGRTQSRVAKLNKQRDFWRRLGIALIIVGGILVSGAISFIIRK